MRFLQTFQSIELGNSLLTVLYNIYATCEQFRLRQVKIYDNKEQKQTARSLWNFLKTFDLFYLKHAPLHTKKLLLQLNREASKRLTLDNICLRTLILPQLRNYQIENNK